MLISNMESVPCKDGEQIWYATVPSLLINRLPISSPIHDKAIKPNPKHRRKMPI